MAKGSVDNVLTVLRSLDVLPEGYDIHINFPGGIPIDGPSAGIAMATGVYSAVHRTYVNNEVAMTGEISIHGEVKPIGGVYAKIKVAKKQGLRKSSSLQKTCNHFCIQRELKSFLFVS